MYGYGGSYLVRANLTRSVFDCELLSNKVGGWGRGWEDTAAVASPSLSEREKCFPTISFFCVQL